MTIKRTKVGSTAGTLSNPGSPCRGTLHVIARRNGSLFLRYKETTRTSECTGDDRIVVKREGDKLRWCATAPIGIALLRRG